MVKKIFYLWIARFYLLNEWIKVNTPSPLKKLRCVIVDDDMYSAEMLKGYCRDSIYVDVVKSYCSPKNFLAEEPRLKYDLCLLDLSMPEIDGFAVADKLNDKLIIFVSGYYEYIIRALHMIGPVDVVPKPVEKERLLSAIEKAMRCVTHSKLKKDFDLFNVFETKGKVKIKMGDIVFVKADAKDARNKEVTLKSGDKYTLMNCTFDKLLDASPHLLQVNKSEVITIELIHKIEHDTITLKKAYGGFHVKHVTLSRAFRKGFPKSAFS
jgi:DNA-binding LytR/AlgR family response regulator